MNKYKVNADAEEADDEKIDIVDFNEDYDNYE